MLLASSLAVTPVTAIALHSSQRGVLSRWVGGLAGAWVGGSGQFSEGPIPPPHPTPPNLWDSVSVQWAPLHVGVHGNERKDEGALRRSAQAVQDVLNDREV